MFDAVDRKLVEWLGGVMPGVPVTLAPPSDGAKGKGVGVYLSSVEIDPPLRTAKRPPLQVRLRYLLTAWDEKEEAAHRLLGSLVMAALEVQDWEVEPQPVPTEFWIALGIAPRPSVVLRVPFRKERPEPVVRRVRQPLVLQTATLGVLTGVVLGPGDLPIMSARVELPALDLRSETDPEGQFALRGLPQAGTLGDLKIRAKGTEVTVDATSALRRNEPLIVRMNLMEEKNA